MLEYNKRLTEVDEILDYLSEEDLMKIPDDVKKFIKENKDEDYEWNYDESRPLKEQDISRDTIAILSYINMEYLLNDEQKELMKSIHELNEKAKDEEESLGVKYGSEDLFIDNQNKTVNEEIKEIVEVKNEGFFKRLVKKIKSLFSK